MSKWFLPECVDLCLSVSICANVYTVCVWAFESGRHWHDLKQKVIPANVRHELNCILYKEFDLYENLIAFLHLVWFTRILCLALFFVLSLKRIQSFRFFRFVHAQTNFSLSLYFSLTHVHLFIHLTCLVIWTKFAKQYVSRCLLILRSHSPDCDPSS